MNFFTQLIVFLVLVFVYLHVRFQLKTNNDLEVYEIDYVDNANLQNVCDIRTPVLFTRPALPKEGGAAAAAAAEIDPRKFTKHQASHDVNIYDAVDNAAAGGVAAPVALSFTAAEHMLASDKTRRYYSADNGDFLEETELREQYRKYDVLWEPSLTAHKYYDLLLGARHVTTPLVHHVDYRRFLYVTRGQILVKMTCWKNTRFLDAKYNWRDFVFYSPMNVWRPQPEYEENYEKIQFVEVIVPAGRVLFIPPYWWYSIKFTQSTAVVTAPDDNGAPDEDPAAHTAAGVPEETVVMGFNYRTYANIAAISPKLFMRSLYWNRGLPSAATSTAPAPVDTEKENGKHEEIIPVENSNIELDVTISEKPII